MTATIPQDEMRAVARRFCREVAAQIVKTMAEGDVSFAQIAARIGQREKVVRKWVMILADGRDKGVRLREIGEIFWACGAVVTFETERIDPSFPATERGAK